jgi:hypothetical protein
MKILPVGDRICPRSPNLDKHEPKKEFCAISVVNPLPVYLLDGIHGWVSPPLIGESWKYLRSRRWHGGSEEFDYFSSTHVMLSTDQALPCSRTMAIQTDHLSITKYKKLDDPSYTSMRSEITTEIKDSQGNNWRNLIG